VFPVRYELNAYICTKNSCIRCLVTAHVEGSHIPPPRGGACVAAACGMKLLVYIVYILLQCETCKM
jgi:hypothetical protein